MPNHVLSDLINQLIYLVHLGYTNLENQLNKHRCEIWAAYVGQFMSNKWKYFFYTTKQCSSLLEFGQYVFNDNWLKWHWERFAGTRFGNESVIGTRVRRRATGVMLYGFASQSGSCAGHRRCRAGRVRRNAARHHRRTGGPRRAWGRSRYSPRLIFSS